MCATEMAVKGAIMGSLGIPLAFPLIVLLQMQPHGTYNAHNRYLQWRSKQLEALWLFNGAIRCSTVGCDANFPGCESGACSRPSRQHLGARYCIG